jgi:hypothetical protein
MLSDILCGVFHFEYTLLILACHYIGIYRNAIYGVKLLGVRFAGIVGVMGSLIVGVVSTVSLLTISRLTCSGWN